MKIKTKVLVLTLVPIVVITVVVVASMLFNFQSSLTKASLSGATEQVLALANSIEAKNLEAVTAARVMANSQESGLFGNHSASLAMAKAVLSSHPQFQGAYFGYEAQTDINSHDSLPANCCTDGRFLPYYYRDGDSIALSPLADMETSLYYDGVKQHWQQNQNESLNWWVTEPYIYDGTPLVEQTYPIIKDGKFVGIAGVDRNLNSIFDLFSGFKPYASANTFLISRLNKFITTTHKRQTLEMQPVADFSAYNQLFSRTKLTSSYGTFAAKDPDTGENVQVFYAKIATGDWLVAMTVLESEILAPVYNSLIFALIVSLTLISLVGACIAYFSQQFLVKPISQVLMSLEELAEGDGDLKVRATATSSDEVGDLARSFNKFVSYQASMIAQLAESVGLMEQESSKLESALDETKTSALIQQSENDSVSAATTEMSGSAREIAGSVSGVATSIDEVNQDVVHGQKAVSETVSSINLLATDIHILKDNILEVDQASKNIGGVLDVISGIADQTNLLALNAAIEAARAGDQGRGFAVVADEVRTLAQRTQNSTTEIRSVIDELQHSTSIAVGSMEKNQHQFIALTETADQAGSSLDKITIAIGSINQITNQIAVAANQQSSTLDEIDKNVQQISGISERTGKLASDSTESLSSMRQVSTKISRLINRFQW